MKKNVMMRVASIMLVLVLMSSSVISGTFAKYVTADEAGDSARVAKFGVRVDVTGTMFAEQYDDAANGNDAVIGAGANITVATDGSHGVVNDLVAPGTKGDMVDIKITGKPEVDVVVNYEATTLNLSGWEDQNGQYYCPLVVTINGTDKYYLASYSSALEAANVLKEAIKGYSKEYDALTDLETYAGETLDISWEWPFTTGDDNDVRDTFLGDSAAGLNAGKSAATFEIVVKCTVTQID